MPLHIAVSFPAETFGMGKMRRLVVVVSAQPPELRIATVYVVVWVGQIPQSC